MYGYFYVNSEILHVMESGMHIPTYSPEMTTICWWYDTHSYTFTYKGLEYYPIYFYNVITVLYVYV